MAAYPYFHVDAFAAKPFAGNQAAVIPLDSWLDDDVLQAIAEENKFAETAYIVPDESGETHYELRWFTPECEIALCGHATLASGHVVLSMTPDLRTVHFRTREAGVLKVSKDGDMYHMALPAYAPSPKPLEQAVTALGKTPSETYFHDGRYALFMYNTPEEVLELEPDMAALKDCGDKWQFICTAPGTDTDVISRVFVPGAGVDEDSVTGSAHCVLTPFWAAQLGRDHFSAYQASTRGGHVGCRLDGEKAILSGACFTVVEGQFNMP